jgi:hypothetical protein
LKLLPADYDGTHILRLGNESIFLNQLLSKGYKHVDVYTDGVDFTVNVEEDGSLLLNKKAALRFMVDDLGMGSSDSYAVLDHSMRNREPVSFFVKSSLQTFPTVGPQPRRDMYYESEAFGMPMQTVSSIPREEILPMGFNEYTIEPTTKKEMERLVHQDIRHAMQAGQTGNQEVFDYSVIGSLAKYTNIGDKIGEYIKVLESALDKIGQILFVFWWRGGDLVEKFGVHELSDMEDLLRNVFKNFGDLLLQLKNKQVLINKTQIS